MTHFRVYALECTHNESTPRFYFGSTYREMYSASCARAKEHFDGIGSVFTGKHKPIRLLFVHLCENSQESSRVEHALTRLMWHVVGWTNAAGGDLVNCRKDRYTERAWMRGAPEFIEDPDQPSELPDDFAGKCAPIVARLADVIFKECNLKHPWVTKHLRELPKTTGKGKLKRLRNIKKMTVTEQEFGSLKQGLSFDQDFTEGFTVGMDTAYRKQIGTRPNIEMLEDLFWYVRGLGDHRGPQYAATTKRIARKFPNLTRKWRKLANTPDIEYLWAKLCGEIAMWRYISCKEANEDCKFPNIDA